MYRKQERERRIQKEMEGELKFSITFRPAVTSLFRNARFGGRSDNEDL